MSKKRRNINKQVAQVEKQIFALYGNSYEAAIKLAEVRKAIEAGTPFTWKDNPAAERKVNKMLSSLADSTSNLVKEGVVTCWDEGEKGAKEKIVASYRGGALQKKADKLSSDALRAHRAKGATGHSYANASRGGMNISTRVWNLTETAKKELEVMIQNGVLEGKSPLEISREIRGYLNKPNTLFRRVKNKETGELELSKAAKDYHPGRGVYRSAYKNARRLAVTEMNAAFRRAEWESYQSNPLVTGYEIRLSNNHTTTNSKGQRVPLKDICDDMAGVYPKTFLWTGWHPQCRCEMIPILVSENDFRARIRARKEGKLASWSAKQVTKMPKGFTDWVEDNKERLASAGSVPYWVRDNFKIADISKGLKQASKTTAVEPAKAKEPAVEPITKYDGLIKQIKDKAVALGGDLTRLEGLRYGGDESKLRQEIRDIEVSQNAHYDEWVRAWNTYVRLDTSALSAEQRSHYNSLVKPFEPYKFSNVFYLDAIAELQAIGLQMKQDVHKNRTDKNKSQVKEEEAEDKAAGKHLQTYIGKVNESDSIKALKKVLAAKLKDMLGDDVKVTIPSADITLEVAKRYAKRIIELYDDYTVEIPLTEVSFKQQRNNYGSVNTTYREKPNGDIEIIKRSYNAGMQIARSRTAETATDKSRCDEGKLQVSTLNHEFAHNIFSNKISRSRNALSFAADLTVIRDKYYTELRGYKPGSKEYNDMFLGKYANKNMDEFLAEAFQEYRCRKNPSKYARLVGELVDKHYKKTK